MSKNLLKKLFYYFFLISFLTSCMDPTTYGQRTATSRSGNDNFNNCLSKSGFAGMGAASQGFGASMSAMGNSFADCK